MRTLNKQLIEMAKHLETLLDLKIFNAFSALFMATDYSIEAIMARLISDLPPEDYVKKGILISEFLQVPRHLILTDQEKVKKFLLGDSDQPAQKPRIAERINHGSFAVPKFAKGRGHGLPS